MVAKSMAWQRKVDRKTGGGDGPTEKTDRFVHPWRILSACKECNWMTNLRNEDRMKKAHFAVLCVVFLACAGIATTFLMKSKACKSPRSNTSNSKRAWPKKKSLQLLVALLVTTRTA